MIKVLNPAWPLETDEERLKRLIAQYREGYVEPPEWLRSYRINPTRLWSRLVYAIGEQKFESELQFYELEMDCIPPHVRQHLVNRKHQESIRQWLFRGLNIE